MNKLNLRLLLSFAIIATVISCKKKGCTDPLASNYDANAEKNENCEYDTATVVNYTVPSTYTFTDAAGNNTVSYGGQTSRMDMLSEMVTYLKTANGSNPSPATLNASTLLSMYDNSYTSWADTNLIDNGKKLKNKTALNDAGVQSMFEDWMNAAATASPGDTSYSYLQSTTGLEWTQVIEKGLMGACFVSQMTSNYLANISNDDNTVADDTSAGKYYTEMEHHWDEAYGYFTDAIDYPVNGTNRFWGKYANKSYLEGNLGTATNISLAFRTGRAAISAGNITDALAQKAIIVAEVKHMVAGMAIHYLNDAKGKIGTSSQDAINHSMSEALAFIFGIQFVTDSPDMSTADIMLLVNQIEANVAGFTNNVQLINAAVDQIATATGLTAYKDIL
tara:strand:+ start:348 stop:1520 length:1173 start_codon:yes stop_codon:yes gene_type:complete